MNNKSYTHLNEVKTNVSTSENINQFTDPEENKQSKPISEEMKIENKEIQKTPFMEILNILEEDKQFALLHPGILSFKTIINELDNEQYFSKTSDQKAVNHIILEDNKKVYPTSEGWIWLLKRRLFTKEELEILEIQQMKEELEQQEGETMPDIQQTSSIDNIKRVRQIKPSNNYLFDRIRKAQKFCMKNMNDNQEQQKLIKDLMMDENFAIFLYDIVSHAILASKSSNHVIGVSNFCVDIGEKICKYLLIIRKPHLFNMLLKLEEKGDNILVEEKYLRGMIKIMTIFFNAQEITSRSIKAFFKEINIEGKTAQQLLFYYLKHKLYPVNQYVMKNKSKLPTLNQSLKNSIETMEIYNEVSFLNIKNQYKISAASIGEIFTEYVLITNNIFVRHKEEKAGPQKKFSKKATISTLRDTDRWTFRVEKAILDQILIEYKPDLPILHPDQLNNLKELRGEIKYNLLHRKEEHHIHNNESVIMIPGDNIQMSKRMEDGMQVKYCVDRDYLKEFLFLLIKTKRNTKDYSIFNKELLSDDLLFIKSYIEMHNINIAIIEQLINTYAPRMDVPVAYVFIEFHEKNNRIQQQLISIINYLCNEIMQFETYKTKTQILEELQTKKINMFDRTNPLKINWKEIPHKNLIEEFVDKLCHRKLFIIRLLNDCIEHAYYDHFTVKHFLDSRARAYPRIIYMNINTNHPAKLFIRLYDINKGAKFDENVKQILTELMIFENTKKQIMQLNPKTIEKDNERLIEEYILSLCEKGITIQDVQKLLNNNKYTVDGSMNLLHDIKPKKEKDRFFIHSLIRSERIIRSNKIILNPPRYVNYAEKDARSSGLQMISLLFRSKSLATWSNLRNGQTVDIYSIIAKACKERKDELLFIADQALKIFNCQDLFQESRTLVPLSLQKLPAILEEWHKTKNPALLLYPWMNLDIAVLPIGDPYLELFLEEFTKYFYVNNLGIFDKYSEEKQNQLIKYIPKYKKIMDNLSKKQSYATLKNYQLLVIIQYALRITTIIRIKYPFLESSPIWDSRSLYKQAIMTRFYNSTRFGRRKDFIACISEKHILPQGYSLSADFVEFLNFLDDFFIQYLNNIEDSNLLDQLSEELSKKEEVIIENFYFTIRMAPKKIETYRLSTGSKKHTILSDVDKPRKNPQISLKLYKVTTKVTPSVKQQKTILKNNLVDHDPKTINKESVPILGEKKERKLYAQRRAIMDPTKLVDHQKLKNMVGPNIIHSMDSCIVHLFRHLVDKINRKFRIRQQDKDKPVPPLFQLALEMNHDCYILSFPSLLPILIEESYLRLADLDYLRYIKGLDISKYSRMSKDDFKKLIIPINPDFIK